MTNGSLRGPVRSDELRDYRALIWRLRTTSDKDGRGRVRSIAPDVGRREITAEREPRVVRRDWSSNWVFRKSNRRLARERGAGGVPTGSDLAASRRRFGARSRVRCAGTRRSNYRGKCERAYD